METPKEKKTEGSSTNFKKKHRQNFKKTRRKISFDIKSELPTKLTGIQQNSCDSIVDSDDENEEAQIDMAIEHNLQECAKRNNISPIKMKKILRKLVSNDHVLALVKLQEESEIAEEKAEKEKLGNANKHANNSPSKINELDCLPKLTRSKMKALNQKLNSLPPLIETELRPDIAALISSDLHSDSEGDDEYEPREEDSASEDDLNATTSDFDSQPRTPASSVSQNEFLSPLQYDNGGIFKVPRERNNSLSQEEIIAKRTRSKLCLQTTAIEAIESTFVPPDVTPDMYDLDKEVDENWMDFLTSFALNQNTHQEDDDPDADPEYIAAEKVKLDAEELKDINISKKELNDLVSELFDSLAGEGCSFEADIPDLETPKKITERTVQSPSIRSPNKKRNMKSTISDLHSDQCLENPIQTNSLQSDQHLLPQSNVEYYNINTHPNFRNDPILSTSYNDISFVPNINSTPQQLYQRSEVVQPIMSQIQPQQNLQAPWTTAQENLNSSYCYSHKKHPEANWYTSNPLNTVLAYPVANSKTRCYEMVQIPNRFMSGTNLPATQPIVAKLQNNLKPVAYVDLTKSPTTKETKKIKYIEHPNCYELWNGDAHVCAVKYFKNFYENKYKAMEHAKPKEPTQFNQDIGFTFDQINLLKQQMQVHVQFATQNYLQCYNHPQFGKLAKSEKDMLLELELNSRGNANSVFRVWNLQKAINLINEWEHDLSVDNEENQAFIRFIQLQIKRSYRSSCNQQYNKIISFPPKLLQRILSSEVFMYPELLPRLPFRTNFETVYHEIIPIESHLLAFGLEKYMKEVLNDIKENKVNYNKSYSLIKLAISKICRHLIPGKSKSRLCNYYKQQLNEDINFNPIKYYDKYKCAPPFENKLTLLDVGNILPPKQQISKLPILWEKFLTNPSSLYNIYPSEVYDNDSAKLLNCSRDKSKNNFKKAIKKCNLSDSDGSNLNDETPSQKAAETNVVIHLNYIFDNSILSVPQTSTLNITPLEKSITLNHNTTPSSANTTQIADSDFSYDFIDGSTLVNNSSPKIERRNSTTDYTKVFTKIHDSLGIQPDHCYEPHVLHSADNSTFSIDNQNSSIEKDSNNSSKHQKLLTDYYLASTSTPHKPTSVISNIQSQLTSHDFKLIRKKYKNKCKSKTAKYFLSLNRTSKRDSYIAKPYVVLARKSRNRKKLIIKLQILLHEFSINLNKIYHQYINRHLNKIYVKFKSLELYTKFLIELKMNCNLKKSVNVKSEGEFLSTISGSSSLSLMNKKFKNLDQDDAKLKKANRLGESLKHMLLPDSKEDGYKKDAIYAYNYYEKVEEILLSSNDANKFKKFQAILKSFDPQKDKVADLYYKIENLLLPDYPDLVEIFLTFLLPSEAVKISKFFEHFIVTNMGTFVQKLNVYFNKQPAQIRKIYNCLSELAEDNDVTMDKIKSKILPLLKGNQFLIDWFLQNFPDEQPPESLMAVSESMNFKEVEANLDGNICEIVPTKDLIDDTDNQSCQLKYINGRLFYGSRILLPAKLAFMAKHLPHTDEIDEDRAKTTEINTNSCVHGIKELGEKCLKVGSWDENEKSEDEDNTSTAAKSVEICDEATFRLHAARLNPTLYGTNDAFSIFNNFVANKAKEDGKISPKKYLNRFNNHPNFKLNNLNKEKGRKSPKKSTPKSPNINTTVKRSPPAETSNAVNTAKKLKAMTEEIDDSKSKRKTLSNKTHQQSKSLNENLLDDETKKTESNLETEAKMDLITSKDPLGTDDIKPWTRDEDKIILEEVKVGFNSEGSLINRIHKKLKYRNINEIIERHKFLMDVLCKLQNRN